MPTMTDTAVDEKEGGQHPNEELHGSICSDLQSRDDWEEKQVNYYRMRHQGIRRKQKPWPNAADLHFPLIDTNIEKLKPLFFAQIVGMDVVATFVPMRQQLAAATTTAEQWFDYKIRERTNLQTAGLSWIDYSLMAGRGVLKVTWNTTKKQVEYTAIDPLFLVVPSNTKELQDTDRVTHVMPMSVAAYKRAGVYKSDKATIDRLTKTSEDDNSSSGLTSKASATRLREGITHDSKGESIIVWEVYDRKDDGKWIVRTFSPAAPEIDLREPMDLPYDHGMVPFVDFAYEIKDAGWYSPRGIAEILAPFEAALCHSWNQKHDSMQLFNKPMFRAERDMPNTMNLRPGPGSILPNGIVPVTMPQPPMSFDEDMVATRSIAEQRVSNPDYGMGQVLDTKNRRTATEIQAIGGQSQQAGDLRARMFRMALAQAYKMSWRLLLQHDKEDLIYRFQEDSLSMDPIALHESYHIEPKGGVNEVNKQFLLQKAIQRKTLFANSAWINQPELDKTIIELDDPSLVKRIFQDPNLKAQDEQVDESRNIPAMLVGENIPARPSDNASLRIGVLMNFIQKTLQTGNQMSPQAAQAFVTRIDALLAVEGQKDNNGAKQLGKQVADYLRSVGMMPPEQPAPAAPAYRSAATSPQLV